MRRRQNGFSTAQKVAAVVVGCIVLVALFHWAPIGGSDADAAIGSNLILSKIAREETCSEGSVRQVSWQPRVLVHENFLTDLECDHLMELASGHLREGSGVLRKMAAVASQLLCFHRQPRSCVISASRRVATAGGPSPSDGRSSEGVFISPGGDPILISIEARLAGWTMMPITHGEDIHVLRYEEGAEYKAHYDYFAGPTAAEFLGNSGQRTVSVVMYLQDAEEGGGTSFPAANLVVQPKKGDAVLFHNRLPNGDLDPMSLHAGDPVVKGTKWVATKWMRELPFERNWFLLNNVVV